MSSAKAAGAIGHAQWELLAQNWAMFEPMGMNESHIAELAETLHSPVLVAGAGQGQLVEACLQQGLAPVVGIDYSHEMIRMARVRRGLDLQHASVTALPFPDRHFQTVVCASGVLNPADPAQMAQAAREFRRVTSHEGTLVAAFFAPSGERFEIGKSLGVFDGATQCNDRVVDLWLARNDSPRQLQLIQSWTAASAHAANRALHRASAFLESWYHLFDAFEAHAGSVQEHFTWRLNGLEKTLPPPAITDHDWHHVATRYDAALMLQLMVFTAC